MPSFIGPSSRPCDGDCCRSLPINVCADVERLKVERTEVTPLGLPDVGKLLEAATGERFEAIIVLAVTTDLRHRSATLLLAQGVHPEVVQDRLGHSQFSVTLDTDWHVLPTIQAEAAGKFDDMLARGGG
jgi:hypothetical protein